MAPFRRYEQLFSSLIADGIAAGDFRPVDVSTAARALIALAVGLLLQSVLDPTGAAWSQVVEESVALLVDGWKRI
jgi:hypothetical protein